MWAALTGYKGFAFLHRKVQGCFKQEDVQLGAFLASTAVNGQAWMANQSVRLCLQNVAVAHHNLAVGHLG